MSDFVLFAIITAGTITGNVIARVIDRNGQQGMSENRTGNETAASGKSDKRQWKKHPGQCSECFYWVYPHKKVENVGNIPGLQIQGIEIYLQVPDRS